MRPSELMKSDLRDYQFDLLTAVIAGEAELKAQQKVKRGKQ